MKTLYIIGGPMGVGKTAVCQCLKKRLDRCVFLDGDWCWDMHPFQLTPETKALVLDNITHVLNNFLHCSAYDNILFCWVLHEQQIWDELLGALALEGCTVKCVSLLCSEAVLAARLQKDIDAGLREPDVLKRSMARLPLYGRLNTARLDVSDLTVHETADRILRL